MRQVQGGKGEVREGWGREGGRGDEEREEREGRTELVIGKGGRGKGQGNQMKVMDLNPKVTEESNLG